MKNNYQYRTMQIKNGYIIFSNYDYGYRIETYLFGSGIIYNKYFELSCAGFLKAEKAYIEQCEKYGKKPNI